MFFAGCGGGSNNNQSSTPPIITVTATNITPLEATQGQKTSFTITGDNLTENGVTPTLADCNGLTVDSTEKTKLVFSCTPQSAGSKAFSLTHQNRTVLQRNITIQAIPTPTVSTLTPEIATIGVKTTLTIKGSNLPITLDVTVQNCSGITYRKRTASEAILECTPNRIGAADVTIRTQANGTVISRKTLDITGNITATGVKTCSTATQNGLPCTSATLGTLHGLQQDGEIQAGRAMSYSKVTRNGDSCVKDNVTGLTWESKVNNDGHLRHKEWQYTWFNLDASTNGGHTGTESLSTNYCGNTLGKCNTAEYIASLNAANYCGYNNWRLPTLTELTSLLDYGQTANNQSNLRLINPEFFNDTPSSGANQTFWSSDAAARGVTRVWVVIFNNGQINTNVSKSERYAVRAVRAD